MRLAHFFPPQQFLSLSSPRLQGQTHDFFCLPYLFYSIQQHCMQYECFFVLLTSPLKPNEILIESIYIFSQEKDPIWQYLWQFWQQLRHQHPQKKMKFKFYTSEITNPYYPTTGFWTSATNDQESLSFFRKSFWDHTSKTEIYRLNLSQEKCFVTDLDLTVQHHCHKHQTVHWSELYTHLVFRDDWGEAMIIPNVNRVIEQYGRLPQMVNACDIKEARVILDCWRTPFIEPCIDQLLNFLSQLGYESVDIGSHKENHALISNSLALRGGNLVGNIQEFVLDMIK